MHRKLLKCSKKSASHPKISSNSLQLVCVLHDLGIHDSVLFPIIRGDADCAQHELLPLFHDVLPHPAGEVPQRLLFPQPRVEAEHLLAAAQFLSYDALALSRPDSQGGRRVLFKRTGHRCQACLSRKMFSLWYILRVFLFHL